MVAGNCGSSSSSSRCTFKGQTHHSIVNLTSLSNAGKADTAALDAQHSHKAWQQAAFAAASAFLRANAWFPHESDISVCCREADTATSDPTITTMHGSCSSKCSIKGRNTHFIMRFASLSAAGKADTATSDA